MGEGKNEGTGNRLPIHPFSHSSKLFNVCTIPVFSNKVERGTVSVLRDGYLVKRKDTVRMDDLKKGKQKER
jgi:hypothetical protein